MDKALANQIFTVYYEFYDFVLDISIFGDVETDISSDKLKLNVGTLSNEFLKIRSSDQKKHSLVHLRCGAKELVLSHDKLTHHGDVLCISRKDIYEKMLNARDPNRKIALNLLSKRKTKTGDVRVAIGSLYPSNEIFEYLHPVRNVFILFSQSKRLFKHEQPFPFSEKDMHEWDLPESSRDILMDMVDKNASLRKSKIIVLSLIWKNSLEYYRIVKKIFSEDRKISNTDRIHFLHLLYSEYPFQKKFLRIFMDFLYSNTKNMEEQCILEELFNLSQTKSLGVTSKGAGLTVFEQLVLELYNRYGETDIPFAVTHMLIELYEPQKDDKDQFYREHVEKLLKEALQGKHDEARVMRHLLKIAGELRKRYGYKALFYLMRVIIGVVMQPGNREKWQHDKHQELLSELLDFFEQYTFALVLMALLRKSAIQADSRYITIIRSVIHRIQKLGLYDFDRFLFTPGLELYMLHVDEKEKRHINLLELTSKEELAFFIDRYNLVREDIRLCESKIFNHLEFLKRYSGSLTMEQLYGDLLANSKIAILSDIHSNLEAFQVVLEDLEAQDVDFIFCLGDIIGYGPSPGDVLGMSRIFDFILMGNHENAIINGDRGFNSYAKEAIEWTKNHMTSKEISTIAYFIKGIAFTDYLFIHASPRFPYFEYINNPRLAAENFATNRFKNRRFCFYGHTHLTGLYFKRSAKDEVEFIGLPREENESSRSVYTFHLSDYHRALINIGSVGQPRDRDPRACYVILDNNELSFVRIKYRIKDVVKKLYANHLPRILAQRLKIGR